MSDEMARRECDELARALPHGLRLSRLETHSYCGRTHRVARFSGREAGDTIHFTLVPGGEVTLGFDGREFDPSPAQVASFAQSGKRYDLDYSIKRFVHSQTSRRRNVCLRPFLIEVEAREVVQREDLEELSQDDPLYREFDEQQFRDVGRWEPWSGSPTDYRYVVERNAGGLRVWRRPKTSLQYVERRLQEQEMQLPTCDQWEHACGGGATTLFRWGNDTPPDFYPTDTCAEDAMLRKVWVLTGGKFAYEAPPPTWDLHQQPNLFGLRIASNPYQRDLVSDAPYALGGDGGCSICGGVGFFLGWLPLATAYRDRWGMPITGETSVADEYHRVRRVIPIP